MKYLILVLILSSCDAVKGLIGAESGVDSDFNDSSCTTCGNGSNNVTSLEDQIISFWKMDETGGTQARNDGWGGSNLVHGAGTLFSTSGQIGSAIQCSSMNGSNYFYVSSPSSDYDFGTGTDFSVAFWAKLDSTLAANQILVEFNYSTPFFRAYVDTSSTNLIVNADNGSPQTATSAFPSFSTWYHFTILVDRDSGISIYRDGSLISNDSNSTPSNFIGVADLYVCGGRNGGGPALTDGFNGDMDSVGVWNRLLNQTEIDALYNGNNTLD